MYTLEALNKHIASHDKAESSDIIKFLYQSEFGCGHLIPDYTDACERFFYEWEQAVPSGELYEPLAKEYCRLNFGDAKNMGIPTYVVMRMFFASANVSGSKSGLSKKLDLAVNAAQDGALKTDANKLFTLATKYKNDGMPMLSHSAAYKCAYSPSYRVIKALYCTYMPIFIKLAELLVENPNPIIAIDGPASSGKTTLAELLSSIFPSCIIKADSFFLPPQMKTDERLSQIGGNINYERFQTEVFDKIPLGQEFDYGIFNCKTSRIQEYVKVLPGLPIIVEGSYSLHPSLSASYDLKLFVKTDSETQSNRILTRNGTAMHKRFINEWIPMENLYFSHYNIENKCDLVINT